jgi:hypothetical protein
MAVASIPSMCDPIAGTVSEKGVVSDARSPLA